jgi:hypothetical protein
MKPRSPGFALRQCLLALLLVTAARPLQAEGIPEPDLVIYGVVRNLAAGGSRMSFGTLSWVFQPSGGGPPISLTTTLTNIHDQFSYALRIPCETEIPGGPVSAGALRLAPFPTTYNRAQVTIEGATAVFSQPAQTNLVLAGTDRGRLERIDLTVNVNAGILPDAWQLQYFGHTGVDPNDDPDRDGLSNVAEFISGTNPTDTQSRFAILNVLADPLGGLRIEWSSVQGKFYILQRSGDLFNGFADLQTHLEATAPLNSFRDASATGTGPHFYRLLVEP